MKYSAKRKKNSLKKGKWVPLLNFRGVVPGPEVLGPGSRGPGPTFIPCLKCLLKSYY